MVVLVFIGSIGSMDIQQLLHLTVTNKASDLHLLPVPPAVRIDGALSYISNYPVLTKEGAESMIFRFLTLSNGNVFKR